MAHLRNLLLIDNDPAHVEAFQEALLNAKDGPFHCESVPTLSQGEEQLREKQIWAIFASLSLPDSTGLDTIDRLLLVAPGVPILVMGGAEDEDLSTEALRRGAKDYLLNGHIGAYSFGRAIRNMAERKTAEEVLFTEKERASVTLNSIGDAVLSTDIRGNVTYLNVVAEKMTGWTCAEALGKPLGEVFNIIDGVTRKPGPNPTECAIQENRTVTLTPNCILIRRDGSESSIEDSAAPIHDRAGAIIGAVIVFHDVTVSRAMTEEMAHRALHDILTDLPNRAMLSDRLTQALSLARRNESHVALLFLDLDAFKYINDSLGHSIGDRLLQSVGARLVACVRESDTVCRLGGDEFLILLSEVAQTPDAAIIAAKVIADLKKTHAIGKHRLRISASVGISTFPDDGEDAETLIKNADIAMYDAKRSGRDKYRFFSSQLSFRLDAGLQAVPVAINISALELRNQRFVQGVQDTLRIACLNPKYLDLELTESALMQHAEPNTRTLGQLKALGVRLAIDDFGTGYSSLSYLTRFPIDILKLDESFVRDTTSNATNAIVISAVLSLGKSLKKEVIAEGVETIEQLTFLQVHGCDEGQGYYFSRPLVPREFAKLLELGASATV